MYSNLYHWLNFWSVKYFLWPLTRSIIQVWLLTRQIPLISLTQALTPVVSIDAYLYFNSCMYNQWYIVLYLLQAGEAAQLKWRYKDFNCRPRSKWKSRDNNQNHGWPKIKVLFGWAKVKLQWYIQRGHREHMLPLPFLIYYLVSTTLWQQTCHPISYLTSYLYRSYFMHEE